MRVIVLMARKAVGGGLFLIEPSLVAALARRRSMLAEQRVFGIPVVIEGECLPALFNVALVTLLTKVRTVNIVFLVTGVTLG